MTNSFRAVLICVGLVFVTGVAGCERFGGAAAPKTEDEKTLYALGLLLGRNLGVFNLTRTNWSS